MATNMPPHNLGEVIDGICAQIDNPDITHPGADAVHQRAGFSDRLHRLRVGRDQTVFQRPAGAASKCAAKSGWKNCKGNREQIVITEIPFNVNRAELVERIADLVNEKTSDFTDITAVRDESDENTRIVIELKRDAIAKVVINNLYKHTALEIELLRSTRWRLIMAGPRRSISRS